MFWQLCCNHVRWLRHDAHHASRLTPQLDPAAHHFGCAGQQTVAAPSQGSHCLLVGKACRVATTLVFLIRQCRWMRLHACDLQGLLFSGLAPGHGLASAERCSRLQSC